MKKQRKYIILYHSGTYLAKNGSYLGASKEDAQTFTHWQALQTCKKRDGYADWRTNGHFRIRRTRDAEHRA